MNKLSFENYLETIFNFVIKISWIDPMEIQYPTHKLLEETFL